MVIISSILNLIKKHVADKPWYTVSSDKIIFCNACHKSVPIRPRAVSDCINSHQKSSKHVTNEKLWKNRQSIQPSALDLLKHASQFARDTAIAFMAADIPWSKINHPAIRGWIEKYARLLPPDESSLRKLHLTPIFEQNLAEIRTAIADNWIYLEIDESRKGGRIIISVLVGVLNGSPSRSYCLNIIEIFENVNSGIIQGQIIDSLHILYPQGIQYEKVRLLISDQASYMTSASKNMRNGPFKNLMHITCLCHALHRVCEKARTEFPAVNELITNLKIIVSKSGKRNNKLAELIDSKLPSLPVDTRWGTWITYCQFVNENFDKIKEFVTLVDGQKNRGIRTLCDIMERESVRQDLLAVHGLQPLTTAITRLEARGLTIHERKNIIDEQLENLPPAFKVKLEKSLSKNPGWSSMFSLKSHEESINYLYAPLVSCDVERSFSQFGNILRDRRQSFTTENFKKYAASYYHFNPPQ